MPEWVEYDNEIKELLRRRQREDAAETPGETPSSSSSPPPPHKTGSHTHKKSIQVTHTHIQSGFSVLSRRHPPSVLIVSPDCLFLSCLDRLLSRTQQTSGVMSSSAGRRRAAVFAGEAPPVKLRNRRFHPKQKSRSNDVLSRRWQGWGEGGIIFPIMPYLPLHMTRSECRRSRSPQRRHLPTMRGFHSNAIFRFLGFFVDNLHFLH